jgi:hypothetical protein
MAQSCEQVSTFSPHSGWHWKFPHWQAELQSLAQVEGDSPQAGWH